MEGRAYTVKSPKSSKITIKVIPGHFSTSSTHINNYVDMGRLKSSAQVSREVARELAVPYLANTLIDTIVCMEGTEVIGAYLAEELISAGVGVMNEHNDIRIITPISNVKGNLVFHSSRQNKIFNKNVLLLVASVSSGKTINRALECLTYYGGNLVGISAIFRANTDNVKQNINALFTSDDIPEYTSTRPSQCPMCEAGRKLDAKVDSDGYTII